MDSPFGIGSAASGGGILGVVIGYFGLGSRIARMEKKMDKLLEQNKTIAQAIIEEKLKSPN